MRAIRVFFLITLISSIGNTSKATLIEWSVNNGGNGHFYEVVLVPEGITWENADIATINAGGYLATITSAEENDFVHNLAISNPAFWIESGRTGPWLGGFQLDGSPEPRGGWQWVTGEPFSYTNWTIHEPDNGTGGTENRLHFWDGRTPLNYAPTWNDRNSGYGNEPHAYVLEVVPEPSTLLLLGLGGLALRKKRRVQYS